MRPASDLHFLNGAGQMGAAIRAHDWSASALGPPGGWPQSLRTATDMMLNSLQPMFIAWGPDLTFTYNDAYAPILGARHPRALGRPFAEIWADIWPDIAPLVAQALAGTAVWQEDLPLRIHRNGRPEQTYFTFTYSPLHDEAGAVSGMFCSCIETTGQVAAARSLREAAESLARSEERYRRQGERLFALFEEAPAFVAVLEGPEHVFTLTNKAYLQLVGHRALLGLPVRTAVPEAGPAGMFEVLDNVFASGEPFVGAGVTVVLQPRPGAPAEDRHLDFVYQPIRDDAGQVTGIFVQGSDVTVRERFVEKQRLLLNELNHRVKNNLATVQSMAAQTARSAPDLKTFLHDFEGRLVALARTHDVLSATAWTGAELGEVLAGELGMFEGRTTADGPRLFLSASQALAMGLIAHELATNAAKYGALSAPGGMVEVAWTVPADGRSFALAWTERGGPEVQPPTRRGFGARLIENLVRGDLHGTVEIAFPPEGFTLRLTAPLTDEA